MAPTSSDCPQYAPGPNIIRINARTPGWQVRIQRASGTVSKFFSDLHSGGTAEALRLAQRERERLSKKFPRMGSASRSFQKRHALTSLFGMTRWVRCQKTRRGMVERVFWRAYWPLPDGKRKTRSFSVDKYGEQEARDLAQQVYQSKLVELIPAGVHRKCSPGSSKGFFVACWKTPTGKIQTKSFSISKYGEAQALFMAADACRDNTRSGT